MRAFHFLKDGMTSGHGSEPPWTVGETRTKLDAVIIPCSFGYHSSPTLFDALFYAPGNVACLVEIDDDAIAHGTPVDKYASRSRKLLSAVNIERELRLFAADCAENVLDIFERIHPDDKRPREVIQAVRDYAEGKITKEQMDAAAYAAAYAAANAATATANAAANAAAYAAAASRAAVKAYAASYAAANARRYHRERFQQIEDYVVAMAEEA